MKTIIGLFLILLVGSVVAHFIPEEQRPVVLRCSGCWYGSEWICLDQTDNWISPPHAESDGTCSRNFVK